MKKCLLGSVSSISIRHVFFKFEMFVRVLLICIVFSTLSSEGTLAESTTGITKIGLIKELKQNGNNLFPQLYFLIQILIMIMSKTLF